MEKMPGPLLLSDNLMVTRNPFLSCWSLNSFHFSLKICTRTEALVHFSREKSNELTDQQDVFYHKTSLCLEVGLMITHTCIYGIKKITELCSHG